MQGIQVAALEVQNVKRAINRYGTLPKGARIGAYLESLKQSGLPCQDTVKENEVCAARSLSPRSAARAQPHMIRSNSSGGVTAPAPNSPRATRANPPLRSFRSPDRHTRTTSPGKPRPRLANLEFPPPPPDLPPPSEDAHQQPPPPPPDCCRDACTDTQSDSPNEFTSTQFISPNISEYDEKFAKQTMKEMLELKLVAEIKERADKKKHKHYKESPPHDTIEMNASYGDPVVRLVSELSESLNMEALRKNDKKDAQTKVIDSKETVSPIDLKASLRKTSFNCSSGKKKVEIETKSGTNFKSQLKKVETNKKVNSSTKEINESEQITDFKSRLRKFDSGAPPTNGNPKKSDQESPDDKEIAKKDLFENKLNRSNDSDNKQSESSLDNSGKDEEEDKRRSTGSISSLKKLWESKEETAGSQLSPKLPTKSKVEEKSPEENANSISRSSSMNYGSKRRTDDKPVVPNKPAVKSKPIGKGGIYATPVAAHEVDSNEEDSLAALRSSLEWCAAEVYAFIYTFCKTAVCLSVKLIHDSQFYVQTTLCI